MEPNSNASTIEPADQPKVTEPTAQPKSNKPLLVTTIITSLLALAGIGASIYFFMDSNNKSTEISNIRANLDDKTATITKLEAEISNLNTIIKEENNDGSETTTDDAGSNELGKTAAIILGDIISENETRVTYKISECSADGPSVKCRIDTPSGESLISYLTTDGILRLTLPKAQQ